MARTYDAITPELEAFIVAQPLFFVATAPLERDGHVNLSPKGLDCFRVLGPRRVAYLDYTGSGNETAAHIAQNGRITFMFCAFSGPPRILRLYGQGSLILPDSPEWVALSGHFRLEPGVRQIFAADIERVQSSCGFAVPRMDYVEQRDTLARWVENKGPQGLIEYRRTNNVLSIDGLPAPRPEVEAPAVIDERDR